MKTKTTHLVMSAIEPGAPVWKALVFVETDKGVVPAPGEEMIENDIIGIVKSRALECRVEPANFLIFSNVDSINGALDELRLCDYKVSLRSAFGNAVSFVVSPVDEL